MSTIICIVCSIRILFIRTGVLLEVSQLAMLFMSPPQLDAGIQEKVCLSSRDGQTVLVVTYADLKACVESAFAELCHHQQQQQMP